MASKLDPHKNLITERVSLGHTATVIAGELGVNPRTVQAFCKKHGIDLAPAAAQVRAIPTGTVSNEEKLEAQVRELRAALAKGRKVDVASARIVDAIEDALADVPNTVRQYESWDHPEVDDGAHHRQLAIWSDWHGGETVNPEVINGLNDYSWDIMEQRVEQLIVGMLSHKRNSPELTGLDIVLGGDMCSGANHDEITVSNEFPMAEQGVKMGYLIAQSIERLVPHYANIRVLSVEGNHPRLVKAPAAKDPHNNMDWVAAILAREYLKGYESVSFDIGRGSLLHTIAGRNVYVFHGDGIRSSMPGVPWGGMMRRVNVIASQLPQRIDHFVYGHFHQANVVQSGRIIGNGSLKGIDEWSFKNFGGGDAPTQLLLTFDEKASRLTDVKYITPNAGI